MHRDLSHGLPELLTCGNQVLRADSLEPVLLRGVNRSGLEYTPPQGNGFLAAARFTEDEIREMVLAWRCNVIRVPFNQGWALYGAGGHTAGEYLAEIDRVISWASALNAYTILDLQWLDSQTVYGHITEKDGRAVENHVPPLPNPESILLWKTLASRYRDEPAAIFDLLNEPHNRLDDDVFPLWQIGPTGELTETDSDTVGAAEWVRWAARLAGEIRAIRPTGIIMVSGVDWGFDLRDVVIQEPNVVYSAHIYANRRARDWYKALGSSSRVPIFVGEWGGTEQDLNFGRVLTSQMRQLGLGWTAWSWADEPRLVKPGSLNYERTGFGELVRNELAAS